LEKILEGQAGTMTEMSEHRGRRIGLTLNQDGSRWSVRVEVWEPERGAQDQPSMPLPFTKDFATVDEARIAGRNHAVLWIDRQESRTV
jgi:hypothetical protein